MYEQIRKNKLRTIFIIVFFASVVITVASIAGYYIVGDMMTGAILGTLVGLLYIFISMRTASSSMLRMTHARQINKHHGTVQEQQLYNIVSQLAMMEQLPEPDVYIIKDAQPNAFAVGMSPDQASVAVTTGLLNQLNRAEIEGVVAHEIAHIKNYDARLKVTAFALGSLLVMIGHLLYRSGLFGGRRRRQQDDNQAAMIGFLLGMLIVMFGNIFSTLMQMWISRKREYLADATAAEMTRNPEALATALEKISQLPKSTQADTSMSAMYFFNPFKKTGDSIWNTHPSTENRIKALRQL